MTKTLSFARLHHANLAAVTRSGLMAAAASAQGFSLDVPYVPTPPEVVGRMLISEVASSGAAEVLNWKGSRQ